MTTAVTSDGDLGICSQIGQACSAIGSLFDSLQESTDEAFRRVVIQKRNPDGSLRIFHGTEEIVDGDGERRVVRRDMNSISYIEDIKTGDLYRDEPQFIVRIKCFALIFGIPFYSMGKVFLNIVKGPLDICSIAINAIKGLSEKISSGALCEAASLLGRSVIRIAETAVTALFEIVKAPLFALGCQFAAIYGLFKPYHGRKYEAILENAWQCGASYKHDFRNVHRRPNEDCLSDIARPCYLAHCFQSRGKVNAPNIIVVRRENL